jgi:hypothetical protein
MEAEKPEPPRLTPEQECQCYAILQKSVHPFKEIERVVFKTRWSSRTNE